MFDLPFQFQQCASDYYGVDGVCVCVCRSYISKTKNRNKESDEQQHTHTHTHTDKHPKDKMMKSVLLILMALVAVASASSSNNDLTFTVTTYQDLNLDDPVVRRLDSSTDDSRRVLSATTTNTKSYRSVRGAAASKQQPGQHQAQQRQRQLAKGGAKGGNQFIVFAEDDDNYLSVLDGKVLAFEKDDDAEAICTEKTCYGELKASVAGTSSGGCAEIKLALGADGGGANNDFEVVCPLITQIATATVDACTDLDGGNDCGNASADVAEEPWRVDIDNIGSSTLLEITVRCCDP